MSSKICSLENCPRPLYAKGLCEAHYAQQRRTGSTATPHLKFAVDLLHEEWRTIDESPGYSVSNYGRVRNDTRNTLQSPRPNKWGYYQAVLRNRQGEKKFPTVHRLVAAAFIPNPLGLPQVNHIDGVKAHNEASNLEWCTAKQNIDHAIRTGLRPRNVSSRS